METVDNIIDVDIIENPVPIHEAFDNITHKGEYSRAAFLLAAGELLNPSSDESSKDLIETAPFNMPYIKPISSRVNFYELHDGLSRTIDLFKITSIDNMHIIDEYASRLIREIYKQDSRDQQQSLFNLLAIFLRHPNELLRTSAAISCIDIVTDPYDALSILFSVLRSGNTLTTDMAYTALTRGMTGEVSPMKFAVSGNPPQLQVSSAESIIVHGTIFSHPGKPFEEWWSPGTGDFHSFLKHGPRPNVYDSSDYFRWSGGWNDYARYEGGAKLMQWIDSHNMQGADVFAHSHGCNLSMLVSWYKKMDTLVLMSCPVHWHLYQPDFSNINNVVSIRVKWDFVIMADRGRQRFKHPDITEKVLPFWFTAHDEPRKSITWNKQNLDQLI